MTVVSPVVVPTPRAGESDAAPAGRARLPWPLVVETVPVLALLAYWAMPLTHATGGRGLAQLEWATGLTVVAIATTRPWRNLSPRLLLLGTGVGASALAVCALSPGGWAGADVAAAYVLAAASALVVLAWLRAGGPLRRDAVLLALLIAGVDQAGQALISWVRNGNPEASISGTFYWHNPFAAFLLPLALVALAVIVWSRSPVRIAAWIGAPLAVAGIVFSSSRATLACLLLGWVVIGGLAVARPRWDRRRALRYAGATLVVVAAVAALSGPPFFAHRSSPFAAADARAASGETIANNSGYRIQFWHEAVDVALHHPVVGAGYRTLGTASVEYTPAGWARSPWAHNGYLQPLTDGGLLLGLPFLAACTLIGVAGLRRFGRGLRASTSDDGVFDAALGVALLAALAHSAADFDWSHPSILVETGLLGALAWRAAPRRAGGRRRAMPIVATAVLLTTSAVSLFAVHARIRTDHDIAAAQHLRGPARVQALAAAGRKLWAGQKPWRMVMSAALPKVLDEGLQVPVSVAREAIAHTGGQAAVEPQLAAERAELLAIVGETGAARAELDRLRDLIASNPAVGVMAVPALASVGERAQAISVAVEGLQGLVAAHDPHVWQAVAALRAVGGDTALVACAGMEATQVAPDPDGSTVDRPPYSAGCASLLSNGGRP